MKRLEVEMYKTLATISQITMMIDSLCGELEEQTSGHEITWGDLGKANYIREKLEELKETLSEE